MRRKALTQEEREIQITNWFAIRIMNDNEEYATLYQIAKGMGLTPSPRLRFIVSAMVIKGLLHVKDLNKPGRWPARGYMLKQGTFKRIPKQPIKVNFIHNGMRQKELLHEPELDYDYNFECSMCGKPMQHRYCGMCTACEQIYNG